MTCLKTFGHNRRLLFLIALVVLALVTLACGLLGTGSATEPVAILTRLPTLTRTPLATLTPTSLLPAVAVAVATATESAGAVPTLPPPAVNTAAVPDPAGAAQSALPAVTSTPAAASEPSQASDPAGGSPVNPPPPLAADTTGSAAPPPAGTATPTAVIAEVPTPASTQTLPAVPTPISETPGWTIVNVQVYPDQYGDGLLLYGEVINNTGVTQELDYITGTFYDAQGQVVAELESIEAHWPIDFVRAGGYVPFEMTVEGIQSVATYDLRVEAEPSNEIPRQDFGFLDLSQSIEAGYYCLVGSLQNSGNDLQDYLVIVAILYNRQDNVINFGIYQEPYLEALGGDDILDFEVCVDPIDQEVARHELRAWGQ